MKKKSRTKARSREENIQQACDYLFPCLMFFLVSSVLCPPAPAAPASPAVANAKVITMETFEVNVPRFRWTHAQTPRFEILSNLEETKFVASVVEQAGQIISLFEGASPLFTQQLDLPAKLIFIQDEIVERLFSQANIGSTDNAYDERMAGAPFHKNTAQFRNSYKVSAFANHSDEQLVIVKLLAKNYMTGNLPDGANGHRATPERQRILECAADLAVTYLSECAQIRAGGKKIPWLDAALNAMRGHIYGGKFTLPRGYSSPVYGKGAFYRTGWISINTRIGGATITLGRYCLACEIDAIKTASNFPASSSATRELWARFMASPDAISLGEIFNGPYAPLPEKTEPMQRQLLMQREVHDFLYYCLLGPDPAARDAFTNFVLATSAGSSQVTPAASDAPAPVLETPVPAAPASTNGAAAPTENCKLKTENSANGEAAFQKFFNATYAEFQAKMYDYYRTLARDGAPSNASTNTPNPWGATGLTVALPRAAKSPPRIKFTLARRPDITRIIADWFDAIGAGANALASLRKAGAESPEAARDPQFIATHALNEARYGDRRQAIPLLEKSAATGIARPSVYRALARLRLDDILAREGAGHRLNAAEFISVLEPLNKAFAQPQPSAQNYILYAALCEHTGIKTPEAYENRVTEACEKFPGDIDMLERILPPFANDAHKPAALRLARAAAQNPALPPEKKQRLANLVEKLEAEK